MASSGKSENGLLINEGDIMKKWEYRVLESWQYKLILGERNQVAVKLDCTELDAEGNKGWELVQYEKDENCIYYTFKREVVEKVYTKGACGPM